MATKRQFNKETLLNSKNIEQSIRNNIAEAMKKMWIFSFNEHGNNRSSTKTDLLHTCWERVIKESFGDYQDLFTNNFDLVVEKENTESKKTNRIKQIVDIFGSKFKVDMLMTNADNIHTVFLLKAPLTSINKNRYNSVLNNFGEIDRFYGNADNKNIDLVFVNLTPKETFIVDDKNNVLKSETVQYLGLNKDDNGGRPLDKLPKNEEVKRKVHEIHIEYDIQFNKKFNEIVTKDELRNQIKNTPDFVSLGINAVDELKNYIKYVINSNSKILNIEVNDNNNNDVNETVKNESMINQCNTITMMTTENVENNNAHVGTQMKFKF